MICGKSNNRERRLQGLRAVRNGMPEENHGAFQIRHQRERLQPRGNHGYVAVHRLRKLREDVPRFCADGGKIEPALA